MHLVHLALDLENIRSLFFLKPFFNEVTHKATVANSSELNFFFATTEFKTPELIILNDFVFLRFLVITGFDRAHRLFLELSSAVLNLRVVGERAFTEFDPVLRDFLELSPGVLGLRVVGERAFTGFDPVLRDFLELSLLTSVTVSSMLRSEDIVVAVTSDSSELACSKHLISA